MAPVLFVMVVAGPEEGGPVGVADQNDQPQGLDRGLEPPRVAALGGAEPLAEAATPMGPGGRAGGGKASRCDGGAARVGIHPINLQE